ncbi:protein FAR1-RELATED SEQUENCE 11-like [Nicotiana tabacum]|uniref:Protein FAR1-RELATED SEQUENCE 11-like n=1 Tax=Nicotiana tabacum TaxID=4097 RepID=A0AC58TE01_TOBAC
MSIAKYIFDGITRWTVVYFDNVHNYELLSDKEVRFLPAYRNIDIVDQTRITLLAKAESSSNIESDALELLKICKSRKDKDVDFQYDFTVDGCQRVENVIWAFRDYIRAYEVFGDVVVFDTTYLLNRYEMPLGSFVLLMNGKHPQTILTDQDLGLIEAIANELPHFKHAFLYLQFKSEFHRLYELGNIEEFEHQWDGLISQFDLGSNRHIKLLYLNRASWALPYLKGYFFAGMVGTAVSIRNYAGEEATMRQKYYNSQIKTFMPMEKHESKVLTPFAFKLLQDAMILSVEYSLFPHSDGSYLVRHYSKTDGGRFVYWNSIEEVVQYSCQEFEFSKILCRLSIRVLSAHNYFMLPDKYFLARWRQENPLVLKFTHMMKSNNDNNELQSLHSTFRDFTLESIKTKGRLEYAKKELQRVRQIIQCFPENEHMKEEHEHVALVNL